MMSQHYFEVEFGVIADEPFITYQDEWDYLKAAEEGKEYIGIRIIDSEGCF